MTFPKDPKDCAHARWTDEFDLATMKPTGRTLCWFCGARLADEKEPEPKAAPSEPRLP